MFYIEISHFAYIYVYVQQVLEAPAEQTQTQYFHIAECEEDVQGAQAAVAALQDLRYNTENGE